MDLILSLVCKLCIIQKVVLDFFWLSTCMLELLHKGVNSRCSKMHIMTFNVHFISMVAEKSPFSFGGSRSIFKT